MGAWPTQLVMNWGLTPNSRERCAGVRAANWHDLDHLLAEFRRVRRPCLGWVFRSNVTGLPVERDRFAGVTGMSGQDAATVSCATVAVLRKFIHPMWVALPAFAWRRHARSRALARNDQARPGNTHKAPPAWLNGKYPSSSRMTRSVRKSDCAIRPALPWAFSASSAFTKSTVQ